MSPSEDVKTHSVVNATSINGKHPVVNNAHAAGLADRHDIATPTPCRLDQSESAELPKELSPVLTGSRTELNSKNGTDTASLADHLALLELKNGDEKQSVFGSIIEQVPALEQASNASLGILPVSTASNNKGILHIDRALFSKDGEVPGSMSRTKQLLASPGADGLEGSPDEVSSDPEVSCRLGANSERRDDENAEEELANEIRELLEPIPVGASGGDGTETPSPAEEKDDCPPAPPSSPADPTRKTKGTFEDFFEIRPSKLGGLGAFAVRELKRNEIILVERPLLRTTHFRLMLDYCNLSEAKKKAYLSLHGAEDGDRFTRVERIKKLNAFAVPGGVAIFEIASRFNHACPSIRNVQYMFDNERGVIEFTICQDVVPAGAELRISYGGTPIDLYNTYGFRCSCGGCTPLTDEDIRKLENQEYGIWDW